MNIANENSGLGVLPLMCTWNCQLGLMRSFNTYSLSFLVPLSLINLYFLLLFCTYKCLCSNLFETLINLRVFYSKQMENSERRLSELSIELEHTKSLLRNSEQDMNSRVWFWYIFRVIVVYEPKILKKKKILWHSQLHSHLHSQLYCFSVSRKLSPSSVVYKKKTRLGNKPRRCNEWFFIK